MGHRIARWLYTGVLALAVLTLAGCAALRADPQADPDRFALADSESALGYEQSDWKRPFWEDDSGGQAVADNGAAARPVPAAAAAPVARAGASLRPQLGIYIDEESRGSAAAYRLVSALDEHAHEYGMTVIKPGALTDALGEASDCAVPTSARCRQTLAIYPGVRALLVIRIQPAQEGGQAEVETRMADTDFGVDYDPMSARVSLAPSQSSGESSGQVSDLSSWSRRVLDLAAERIAIAPWFTHSFAREGDSVYVSAGPRSGLATGTMLAVHGEGAIVRAPGGRVVGWNPGPIVGRLEVKKLIGQRTAVAESVSGEMPQPRDRLTVVQ